MFHAEKARHEDVVRRQERIVGQPIARDPQGGVVIAEDHVARDDRRQVGAQEDAVRGIVVCPFETQRTDRDLDVQFLADLADKTRFGRLSRLQLSAGEFPETAEAAPVRERTPRNEDFVLVRQNRRADGQFGFFLSRNGMSLPGVESSADIAGSWKSITRQSRNSVRPACSRTARGPRGA